MAILTQRKTWRRPEPPMADRGAVLSQQERLHVAAALIFLKRRYGSWADLAVAMDMREKTVAGAATSPRRIGPGAALRVATLAQVPAGELLAGRWPAPGTCPLCGGALPTPPTTLTALRDLVAEDPISVGFTGPIEASGALRCPSSHQVGPRGPARRLPLSI